jgi:hypothetical protein
LSCTKTTQRPRERQDLEVRHIKVFPPLGLEREIVALRDVEQLDGASGVFPRFHFDLINLKGYGYGYG